MKKQNKQIGKGPIDPYLRETAEEWLARAPSASLEVKEKNPEKLLHELQVHQIELEMQNEELRKSQFALEESRKRYEDLYDFAPVGYFTLTQEALIKEANLTGATLLGVARQKLMNDRFRRFVAPSDFDLWDRHFLSVLQQDERQSCDLTLQRQDGSTFPAGLESIRVEGSSGAFDVHTAITDITERLQAEDTLRKSEEKYRSIFENAAEGIFQATPEGRFLVANPALARMYGYGSSEELIEAIADIGQQIYVNPEQRSEYIRTLEEKGAVKDYELHLKRKDGTTFWISNNARPVRDSTGKTLYYEGLSEDITSRRESERRLKENMESLRKALGGIIQVISATVETRDPYTAGHQQRVADLARAIAQEMGLPEQQVDGLRVAGTIHDLGKVSIPAEILSKPTRLMDIEYRLIQAHSQTGHDILKGIDFPWPIAEMVLQHHERMDGSGYPRGLKGEEILLEARIIAVADVIEAIASHRPYRAALGIKTALEEIEKNAGVLYDREAVKICLRLFREKLFDLEGVRGKG